MNDRDKKQAIAVVFVDKRAKAEKDSEPFKLAAKVERQLIENWLSSTGTAKLEEIEIPTSTDSDKSEIIKNFFEKASAVDCKQIVIPSTSILDRLGVVDQVFEKAKALGLTIVEAASGLVYPDVSESSEKLVASR